MLMAAFTSSVTVETAGSAPEHGLALTRAPVHPPARRAPLARQRGSDLLHPARGLALQPRTSSPHPDPRIPRFSPAFCPDVAARVLPRALRRPGHVADLQVLDPDHVEPPRDAGAVFSAQSLRRSLSRARSRAIACLTRPRRFELRLRGPAYAAAAATWSAPARSGRGRAASRRWTGPRRPLPPGQCPLPGRYPVRVPARRSRRRRYASGPRGPGSPGRTWRPAARRGTSGTGPSRLWAPRPGRSWRRHAAHVPLPPAPPGDAESLVSPGLAPGRPPGRVRRVEECGHGLGEVAQRLLLDGLGADGQPRVFRPGLGELPALLQVARGVPAAWVPVGVLLDGQVPDVPGVAAVVPQHRLLGETGDEPVPGHANTLSDTPDISGEVKRRVLPGLKTGVSTLRS